MAVKQLARYPVDLYYLVDVSASMQDNLDHVGVKTHTAVHQSFSYEQFITYKNSLLHPSHSASFISLSPSCAPAEDGGRSSVSSYDGALLRPVAGFWLICGQTRLSLYQRPPV